MRIQFKKISMSLEILESCSLGNLLGEVCHKLSYSKTSGLKLLAELSSDEKYLVIWRTGLEDSIGSTICYHHEHTVLKRYASTKTKCCNPFKKEKHTARGSLREISLETAKEMKILGINVTPGDKLCPACRIETDKHKEYLPTGSYSSSEVDHDDINEQMELEISVEDSREFLSSTLNEAEVSPLKLHAIGGHSRTSYGKRKMLQVQRKFQEKQSQVQESIAYVLDVKSKELKNSESAIISKEIEQKANDLDIMVDLMKEKIKVSSRKVKIQILTMTPLSWTVRKTANIFGASNYMVRQAFKLRKEHGIFASPEHKKGQALSDDVVLLVTDYYCDDENSRLLPGKKDYVSIGRNQHMQKRLILSNLKELYSSFKKQFNDIKIGFSKFCMLRPKWCVTVGASGTHSVCVCTSHQNITLALNAIKLDKDYHHLLELIVCSRDKKECMIHRCPNCPGIEPLKNYLREQLNARPSDKDETSADANEVDNTFAEEEDYSITFNQWTSTDRAELIKQTAPLSEFIELVAEKLDKITVHSFIARTQGKYLKQCKEDLKESEVIVLVDFAENYKFLVQDEIQGYHWNKSQCTLHPAVVYTKKNGKLEDHSICFLSDDLNHDVHMVYQILKETSKHIIESINPQVKSVNYFSDGCAGQFKNCKNFLNLCFHHADFGTNCTWSFFATSHGKSTCDGVGGTVKRITSRASLQRPFDNQILSAVEMFKFCKEEIKGINFKFIPKETMEVTRANLETRFLNAKTLPGTRSYHHSFPCPVRALVQKERQLMKNMP